MPAQHSRPESSSESETGIGFVETEEETEAPTEEETEAPEPEEGEGEGEGEGVEEGGGVEPAPLWKTLYNKNATPCDVYEQQLRDWLNQSPNINF